MSHKHIFFVAGEASGDEHAAKLIHALQSLYPNLSFSGIGGDKMSQAGANILYPLANYGVTGFTEVIKQWCHIRKAYRLAKTFIEDKNIDLIVFVDYPGFNIRLAKAIRSLRIPALYYISPQIWAWKKKRVYLLAKIVDAMAVILPFEKKLYEEVALPTYFVGHPLSEHIHAQPPHNKDYIEIALIPGSRDNEVERLLPLMLKASELLLSHNPDKELKFILPLAPSINLNKVNAYLSNHPTLTVSIIEQQPLPMALQQTDCCMAASGTATLEIALLEIPMVIAYKTSLLTYCIASQVIQCRWIGLCNLLAEKTIVPELIQDDCQPDLLFTEVNRYINDRSYYQQTKKNLNKINRLLENKAIDCKLEQLIASMLKLSAPPQKDAAISQQNSQIAAKKTSD